MWPGGGGRPCLCGATGARISSRAIPLKAVLHFRSGIAAVEWEKSGVVGGVGAGTGSAAAAEGGGNGAGWAGLCSAGDSSHGFLSSTHHPAAQLTSRPADQQFSHEPSSFSAVQPSSRPAGRTLSAMYLAALETADLAALGKLTAPRTVVKHAIKPAFRP